MRVDNPKLANTILAVLKLAQDQSVDGILKTSLVKYVYLVDVFYAEIQSGEKIWTDLPWSFYHFGPYAQPIQDCVDDLVKQGKLVDRVYGDDEALDEKECHIYSLPDYGKPQSLKELGLQGYVPLRLGTAIKKFAWDLPGLLNYVYFDTTPMQTAKPGDTLDFSECRKFDLVNVKPIQLKSKPKKLKAARKKISEALGKEVRLEKSPHLKPSASSLDYSTENTDFLPLSLKGKIIISKD